MRNLVCSVLLLVFTVECFGQLVRKKDYDAAFALQVGGETSMSLPFDKVRMFVTPAAGLKMTFPFTRKWFLGAEVNYSEFKYNDTKGNEKFVFDNKQIQVPMYLKYMLNCNKASVLFGISGHYVFDAELSKHFRVRESDKAEEKLLTACLSDEIQKWNAGIIVGYEYQIIKHLNIMLKIGMGVRNIVKSEEILGQKFLPFRAGLTLSYDIFRMGDCGCD